MSWIGLHVEGGTEAPCSYSGDHRYGDGGICANCGERLRCLCGRFLRVDQLVEHEKVCPVIEDMAEEEHP